MPVNYIKIWKHGEWQKVEEDRVQRFLDEGWTLDSKSEKVSQDITSKNKITADAQVTSTTLSEDEDDELLEELEEDLFDSEDDELPTQED